MCHSHTQIRGFHPRHPLSPRQDARAVARTLGPSAFGGSSRRRPAFGGEETCWGPPSSRAGADRPRCWSVASSNYQGWVLFWSISYTVSTPETITCTCNGQFFIVEKTRVRWKLERGRYVRDHKRLDVLGTGRYLSNMFLNSLLEIETSDEEEEGGGRR